MRFTLPFLLTTIAFALSGGFLALRILGEKDVIYFSGATIGAILGVIIYQLLRRIISKK